MSTRTGNPDKLRCSLPSCEITFRVEEPTIGAAFMTQTVSLNTEADVSSRREKL